MDNKTKPTLNMRYYNKEIDDDLPYVGHLDYDEETGFIYDEEGDVVDEDTIVITMRIYAFIPVDLQVLNAAIRGTNMYDSLART